MLAQHASTSTSLDSTNEYKANCRRKIVSQATPPRASPEQKCTVVTSASEPSHAVDLSLPADTTLVGQKPHYPARDAARMLISMLGFFIGVWQRDQPSATATKHRNPWKQTWELPRTIRLSKAAASRVKEYSNLLLFRSSTRWSLISPCTSFHGPAWLKSIVNSQVCHQTQCHFAAFGTSDTLAAK